MFPSCRSVVALALVLAALPLIVVSRIVLACLRTVAPSLVARVEQKLPYAIPNLTKPSQPAVSTLHVAVIGGGIAGMGAAFALKRAGARVTVFEPREALGGNAKTANWLTRAGAVRTGLSVLAWPKPYFHNYNELLSQLNVPTTSVNLPFAVREPGKFTYYHDSQESKAAFASDLRAFQRVVGLVKLVNWCFECASAMPSALVRMCSFGRLNPVATSHAKSVYTFHFLSPMNVIPLRTFCLWMGMSRHFWDTVATPIWSSTFLTGDISTVPSSIAPVLNDIMPLHGECTLETWQGDSSEVFDRMAAGVEVRLRTQVVSVGLADDGKVNVGYVHGHASNCHMFDRAVFACPAEATAKMLETGKSTSSCRYPLETRILSGVTFAEPKDTTFIRGVIHGDSTVLPSDIRDQLLAKYANFVDVQMDGVTGKPVLENTFIVSSWYPAAQRLGADKPPMMVSYNLKSGTRGARAGVGVVGEVSNALAHPELSVNNQLRALALRFVQGRAGLYYAGSSATLANGHDLSLLSGFVVAAAIGAPYPFMHNPAALRDFKLLQVNPKGSNMSSKLPASFPPVSDGAIWDFWMSQHYLPATTLALEIGLFELLGRQPTGISAADIASGLGLGSRSVDALLAVLCGLKLVAQSGGVFTLTPLATTYMLADSQYYWGHMLLGDRSEMHARLKKCVESDKPVGAAAEWESGELTEDRARYLTAEMHCHSTSAAMVAASVLTPLFSGESGVKRLLDVAGGSAVFSCSFAQRHPELNCTVLELPVVCRLIENEYIPRGLAARVNTISLNMFEEDWPTGYDAHFFSNVWHDWNEAQCTNLAARSFKALPSGGRILLHEMLLTDGKDGPLTTACFSMHMFIYTKGRQYTFKQLECILAAAGFGSIAALPSHHHYSIVVGVKP